MLSNVFVLLAGIILMFSTNSLAESGLIDTSNSEKTAVSFRVGFVLPKDDSWRQKVDNNAIEVNIRRKLSPFIAIEGGTGYFQTSASNGVIAHGIPLTASLKGFFPLYIANLYAGGGLGEYLLWAENTGNKNNTFGRIGFHSNVGAELYLGRSEMFILDYKRTWIRSDSEFVYDLVSFGFGYRF